MPVNRKILLMRHAKSSWEDRRLRDYDRPLNKRGLRDAPVMGGYLKELGLIPDEIYCSPAVRARSTVLLASREMGIDEGRIAWDEKLYFEGPDAYIDAIRSASAESNIVMTVGHNPMTEYVIELLSDKPFHDSVPTAAITCLELNAESWDKLSYGSCSFQWMMRPKDLK